MTYQEIARAQIAEDEGFRDKVYPCTEGFPTVGYGHRLSEWHARVHPVGTRLPVPVLKKWFDMDLETADKDARAFAGSAWEGMSDARRAVLVNMAFNIGGARLAKFTRFRAAVVKGHWPKAAREMLDSKWAQQVGDRAKRLADKMRDG